MEKERIIKILKSVKAGKSTIKKAFEDLKYLPYEDLGFVKIDHHRSLRMGYPEVVFCQGKTFKQIEKIFRAILERNNRVLLTRVDPMLYPRIKRLEPRAFYSESARMIAVMDRKQKMIGKIAVVCAGTVDIPIAEESTITALVCGSRVERIYDVGVAGIHRLLDKLKSLASARCVVAVAGMEGALPSVIGGLVSCPVIAVPTSVGYGTGLGGIAALITMLNSCAANVTVVNIDNGFGAGYVASLINQQAK